LVRSNLEFKILFVKDLLSVIIDRPLSIILIFSFLFIQAACSSVEPLTEPSDQTPESEIMTESDSRDMSDLEDLYWSRLENSRMSFVQADVDFMTDMITHHSQALIMSDLAPENGASRAVQTLAARIHNAQQDEIATMQKWLRDRNQPVPLVHVDGLTMMIQLEEESSEMDHNRMDHEAMGHQSEQEEEEQSEGQMEMSEHTMSGHSMGHHDMPGMLTQEQLEELAASTGREFDRNFLSFMIEHHLGAVFMVDELFASNAAANDNEIFDLASGIHAEQITEINRMRLMLDEIEEE